MQTATFHLLLAPVPSITLAEAQESLFLATKVLRAQPALQVSWLLDGIANDPALCVGLRQRVDVLLQNSSGLRLFVETGLPMEQGFLINIIEVISKKLLPVASRNNDLGDFLYRLFPSEADALWLETLSQSTSKKLIELLSNDEDSNRSTWRKIRAEVCDAVEILALKVASLGLAEKIHTHAGSEKIQESPFYQLLGVCQGLLITLRLENAEHDLRLDNCVKIAVECRNTLSRVIAELETTGVSVSVVHRVDVISRSLNRIVTLLKLLKAVQRPESDGICVGFAAAIVRHRLRDESLGELCRNNLTLLSQRIVESASARGEHYITQHMREFRLMFYSACGGGLVTAFTTLCKYRMTHVEMPLLVEGVTVAFIYGISFVLIQAMHFTLATKQPSHTAASLAHALSEGSSPTGDARLVSLVVRICRSQLVAIAGNIFAVVPTALFLSWLASRFLKSELFNEQSATHILESLSPVNSLTFFYAIFTGILLWFSSILAGFAENWSVYRKLPKAIAEHRFGHKIGRDKMQKLGAFVEQNISGFAGNISLGILLAGFPLMGKLTGLPLDVRHVTLSTGALTFSVYQLGTGVLRTPLFWKAVVGIFLIGFLNVVVSFLLALVVAFRAQDARLVTMWQVLGEVLRQAWRKPLSFIWPRGESGQP